MRAKFIFEKFIENSDPIKDMGIGYLASLLKNKFHDFKDVSDVIPAEWPDWLQSIGVDPIRTNDIVVIFSDEFEWNNFVKIKKYLRKNIWDTRKGKFIVASDEGNIDMDAEMIIINKKYLK